MAEEQGPVKRSYRRHDPAVRAAAVVRVIDGCEGVEAVARGIAVNGKTVRSWVDEERRRRLDPDGTLSVEAVVSLQQQQRRIRALERENAELRREAEFLKKAGAFFRELDQRKNSSR